MKKILIISCAFNLKAPRVEQTVSSQTSNTSYEYNILDENGHFVLYDENGNFRRIGEDVPFILGLHYLFAQGNELDRVGNEYEKKHFTPEQIAINHVHAERLGNAILNGNQTNVAINAIKNENDKRYKKNKQNPRKTNTTSVKKSR